MGSRVGAEAIGRVRLLRRQLSAEADAFRKRAQAIPSDWIDGAAFAGKVGQERCWRRILGEMPEPYKLDRADRLASWRYVVPVGQVIEAKPDVLSGDEMNTMAGVFLGRGPRKVAIRVEEIWGMSFASHALARLLERSGFQACPQRAMGEAHSTLLGAPAETGAAMREAGRWAVPGGPGAFLCTIRGASDDGPAIAVATAETWVSADQLFPEQEAQVAAVRFRRPGPTLGEGMLRPVVLR